MPIIQALIILLGPLLGIWLLRKWRIEKWLSPVVWSYALGILLANSSLFPVDRALATTFSEATVLLAIPLLLFSTDIKAWLRYAPQTLLSFGLCILSGLTASTCIALFYSGKELDPALLSGMLVGVYTGGTPNMQAIGLAMGASEKTYILLNASDIFCSGIYLLFITSVAHRFLGWFLPDFKGDKGLASTSQDSDGKQWKRRDVLLAIGLAVLVIGAAVGLVWLFTGALKSIAWIILLLTSFSILASFSPQVRAWKGAFEAGEYLLLVFCLAIGLLTDFQELWSGSTATLIYTANIFLATIGLHFLLSALFRIDRDTTLITSTAAIYGPVFIGQVASVIGNRTLVFSGMATGLIGYAVGNFLGIGLTTLLRSFGF